MMNLSNLFRSVMMLLLVATIGWSQEAQTTPADSPEQNLQEKLSEQVQEVSKKLNQSETAREVSAGILDPIYRLADVLAFPTFYWIAFALDGCRGRQLCVSTGDR